MKAREIQNERFKDLEISYNAQIQKKLKKYCDLDNDSKI